MIQQGVDEGTIGVPRGRVHNQSWRFVEYQNRVVFVNDVGRNLAIDDFLKDRVGHGELTMRFES